MELNMPPPEANQANHPESGAGTPHQPRKGASIIYKNDKDERMTIASLTQLPAGRFRMEPGYHEGADFFFPQSAPFKGLSFWRVVQAS